MAILSCSQGVLASFYIKMILAALPMQGGENYTPASEPLAYKKLPQKVYMVEKFA